MRPHLPPPPPPPSHPPGDGVLFLPRLFSSNMVLQRAPESARVWGWAACGEMVNVSLADIMVSVRAASNGSWSVLLRPLQAADGLVLSVSAASGKFIFSNVRHWRRHLILLSVVFFVLTFVKLILP